MEIAEVDPAQVLRMTISDLLKQQQRASEVLKKLGLPFRNNEDKTLMEVCTPKQLNEYEVIQEISHLSEQDKFEYPLGIFNWSPELVIKYLEEEHHQYTRSLMQDAVDYEQRTREVHRTQHPELKQLKWYLEKLREKLNVHLKFEEDKFFPALLKFFSMTGEPTHGTVKSLKKQIGLIQKDQEEIEYIIGRIKDISNDFCTPEKACTTFCLLYNTLQNLYDDLEKHHFLEERYVLSKLETKLNAIQS